MKKCFNCQNFIKSNNDENLGFCKFWESDTRADEYCIEFKRNLEDEEEYEVTPLSKND